MPAIDKFDLSGKTALVTGASSGLGRRFAEVLAEQGAAVALAARRTERLEELRDEIAGRGGRAAAVALDVTDRDSITEAFKTSERELGPVDILVNNAGMAVEKAALEMRPEDWMRILDTNLTGVWYAAQEAALRMRERGGGAIINIASILGFRVSKMTSAYAISKAGVVQMTKALALELARDKIRVNAIAPGYVLTEINQHFFETETGEKMIRKIPQRRIADPEELDGVLLLLASDASAFMTGSVVTADGGHSLVMG